MHFQRLEQFLFNNREPGPTLPSLDRAALGDRSPLECIIEARSPILAACTSRVLPVDLDQEFALGEQIPKMLGIAKHPELRDMYFGNYEKVVYISQVATPDLIAKAELAAEKLGLAFEHRPVGYGDLATSLDARFPA